MLLHAAPLMIAGGFWAAHPDVVPIPDQVFEVKLVEEGFDLAIRVNSAPDDSLIGRCFAHDDMLLVACPTVFDRGENEAPTSHYAKGGSPVIE